MTKPITAVAIMMLVDDGKISLDDPVANYISEFEPKILTISENGKKARIARPKRAVTIRDLLSHCYGLMANSPLDSPERDRYPLELLVKGFGISQLMCEPRIQHAYSNAGINTVGRVIEILSGMNYENFVQTQLLDPLGMTDTTFWPSQAQLSRLAATYTQNRKRDGPNEAPIAMLSYPLDDRQHRYAYAASGLFSTASDSGHSDGRCSIWAIWMASATFSKTQCGH